MRYRDREYARAFMIDPFLDVRSVGLITVSYDSAYRRLSATMAAYRDRLGILRDSQPSGLVWPHAIAAVHSNHLQDAIADLQALARGSRRRDLSGGVSAAPLATNNYLYLLAALLQRAGFTDDATRLYHEVLTADIGHYEAHVQLARIYEAESDWTHALEQRRAAVEVFPENHRLVMDLGVTQYRAGMLGDAEATLRDAQAAGPRDPRTYYWLGIVQQARGEKADAQRAYAAYLRLASARDSVDIAAVRQRVAALQ
jgi:tetratricopeptide (TPR) repeat protein